MVVPVVGARMEESRQCARVRIDTCHIRAFITVASEAGERQVVKGVCSTVLFGDDVIDLKRRGMQFAGQLAVLAMAVCTFPNTSNYVGMH